MKKMMKQTSFNRYFIRLIIILFMLTLLLATGKVFANERTTIRVVFYPLDGFFEKDSNGNPTGYGVDYLDELRKYSDIDFTYVPIDSWEKGGELLRSGKADIMMPVSERTDGTESPYYNYTSNDMLTTYNAILTLNSRKDLYFGDDTQNANLRLAITQSTLDNGNVADYLSSIEASNLSICSDYNACRAALDAGTVDGVVTNIMDMTDDLKLLARFNAGKNYIITLKNSTIYSKINDALTNMKIAEPNFQNDLYMQYYPDRASTPFTKEESNYLAKNKNLTVGYFDNRKPVTYTDKDGTPKGIAIDMMNALGDELGITFTYKPYASGTQTEILDKGEVDLMIPMVKTMADEDYFCTPNLFDVDIRFALPYGKSLPASGGTIGVTESSKGTSDVIKRNNPTCTFVDYPNTYIGLLALQAGKIDAFAGSNFVLDQALQNPRFDNLIVQHYEIYTIDYGIGGKNNTTLQSILTKGINRISETDRSIIINQNTTFNFNDLNLLDKLYSYRTVIVPVGIVIIIVLLGFLFYLKLTQRYMNELKISRENFRKASAAKTDFLSSMSHEIRTPMNAILGLTTLAMDKVDDPEEEHTLLTQIKDSSDYLLSLINDILDMSRIESDRLSLEESVVDGPIFLDSIATMMRPNAEAQGITLVTDFTQSKTKWVKLDPIHTKQIYVNLINNAIKFSPAGSTITWRIVDSINPNDPHTMHMVSTITDEGCGMSEAFMSRMFEPFEQEHNQFSDKTPGTGLGLSIVYQLVQLMKGEITCDSTLGKGTTFTISLDRRVCTDDTIPADVVETLTDTQDLNVLEGRHILLVEDNEINAIVARRLLDKHGMTSDWAKNGQEGVDMALDDSTHYDAILMDVRMPFMDGLEATEHIRKAEADTHAPHMPILAMTADAFTDERNRTKAAGMDGHLTKPVVPDDLYAMLAHFISQNQA